MKKLTLILSMMIALIGLNANAAMYIVGDAPFGGWNPPVGVEMTELNDGTYKYDATFTQADVYFIFASAVGDWTTVNANRYDCGQSVDLTVEPGVEFTVVKGNSDKSFKFSGTVGQTYTITFNPTTLKAKVEGYVEPITEFTYTVAGKNEIDIFGTEWDPSNTANDMTLDATDGLYKLEKKNIEITAGYNLEYKVVQNHSWGTNWGQTPNGQNQNYYFEENGTYDLTFIFDLENEVVSLDVQQTQVGPAIDPYTGDLYIVGQVNDNGWNPSTGIAMLTEDEDTFTLANAQIIDSGDGYGYFSFMAVLGSNSDSWPANGYRIGAAENGTLATLDELIDMGGFGTTGAFKVEPGYYNITVVLSAGENGRLKLTAGQAPEPVVDDVYIIGDVNNIGWSATEGVKMTYNEGIYTANITTQKQGDKEVGYFGFTKKLADPESESEDIWEDIKPYRFGPESVGAFVMTEELLGQECTLATDGSYESIEIPEGAWTVTVDLVNNKFTINGTWPTDTVVPEPTTVYTVVGPEAIFGSNWNETDTTNDMTLVEGLYTWSKENVELAAGSFEFKIVGNHDWANEWPTGFGNNWIKYVDEDGIYTINITYDPEAVDSLKITCEITKTGAIEPVHYDGDVYILGEVNDNGGWFPNIGVKMTRNAETNVYTATITTAGENVAEGEEIGYSYFSFTKKLAENDWENGGWDEINSDTIRFGAVTDGNPFLVTDEMLGIDLTLAYAAEPTAFKIPAGQWNLTLSVDDMKLVIEKAGKLGDVNKDGQVRIDDVTALIDALLSGNTTVETENYSPTNANVNQEGGVTIADVTALIDLLLSGNAN